MEARPSLPQPGPRASPEPRPSLDSETPKPRLGSSWSRSSLSSQAAPYDAADVDAALRSLEQGSARQIATAASAVRGVAAERDLLGAAEGARDLLSQRCLKGSKAQLDEVFGGTCERIGRLRVVLDGVSFSRMHASDGRWRDLRNAAESIEAVLKELGSFRAWQPPLLAPPRQLQYRGVRRRVSPGSKVSWKLDMEGQGASFSVAPPLPEGLALDEVTGVISGQASAAAPEATYVVTARNDAGAATFELVFGVGATSPTSLGRAASAPSLGGAASELATGDGLDGALLSGGSPPETATMSRRQWVLLETTSGRIVTELLPDGRVAWSKEPPDLEARIGRSRVLRTAPADAALEALSGLRVKSGAARPEECYARRIFAAASGLSDATHKELDEPSMGAKFHTGAHVEFSPVLGGG